MSSDRQFEKWLEGPPSTDQVRSRLDDYTTKIQDIAQVALDPDSAPFAEAKVKQVRANSKLIQQHLRRTEILAEWLLENIDEAADITPSRQTAETYLEYVSALDLYHRAEEIQEELVTLYTRAADNKEKAQRYQRSVQEFVETGRDLGLNRKDLNSLKSSLNGIETTMEQCEGDTLDKMKAAIMLLKFGRRSGSCLEEGDYQAQRAPLHQGCGRLSG